MTIDLDALEAAAKAATPGQWVIDPRNCDIVIRYADAGDVAEAQRISNAGNDAYYIAAVSPDVVLELIAEVRKARAERDWAVKMVNSRLKFRICPTPERHEECHKEPRDTLMPQETCRACWLKAAREAVEGKQ